MKRKLLGRILSLSLAAMLAVSGISADAFATTMNPETEVATETVDEMTEAIDDEAEVVDVEETVEDIEEIDELTVSEDDLIDEDVDDPEAGQAFVILYSNLLDGSNSSKNPGTYEYGVGISSFSDAKRSGYKFGGWYSDSKFTNRIKKITSTESGTKILFAKWCKSTYNVKFSKNNDYYTAGEPATGTMDKMTGLKYGTEYTFKANAFKKKGYKFKGWNTSPDGTGIAYTNKQVFKNLPMMQNSSTLTLYAQWGLADYTITYKTNGDSRYPVVFYGTPRASYNIYSTAYTLPTPTRTGYDFKGWYKESTFKTKVTEIKAGATGDKKYYAKWSKHKYTITYVLNGSVQVPAKNSSKNPATYTCKTDTFSLKKPTRKGYKFDGWYTTSNFATNTKVTEIPKYSLGNKTLYAKWILEHYTVTLDYRYDSKKVVAQPDYTVNSAAYTLPNISRGYYHFKGWYKEKEYKTRVYERPAGSAGNKTYYAKWSPYSVSIKFNANGGTGTISTLKVKYGKTATLPSSGISKSGYRLVGWSISPTGSGVMLTGTKINGTELFQNGAQDGGSVTLYAVWTYKNVYMITDGSSATYTKSGVTKSITNITGATYSGYQYWGQTTLNNVKLTISAKRADSISSSATCKVKWTLKTKSGTTIQSGTLSKSSVAPNGSISWTINVNQPLQRGDYILKFSNVKE